MVQFEIFRIEEFLVASMRLDCVEKDPDVHSEIEAVDDQKTNEFASKTFVELHFFNSRRFKSGLARFWWRITRFLKQKSEDTLGSPSDIRNQVENMIFAVDE